MNIVKALTTPNVGTFDRLIRALPIILVGALWYTGVVSGWLAITLAVGGVLLLITALTGSCSIYYVLGVSTAPARTTPTGTGQ